MEFTIEELKDIELILETLIDLESKLAKNNNFISCGVTVWQDGTELGNIEMTGNGLAFIPGKAK